MKLIETIDQLEKNLETVEYYITEGPLLFDTLPFSHITGKNRRRYDFIYKSDRWATRSFNYYYSESIEASSDHAMVVGWFNKV